VIRLHDQSIAPGMDSQTAGGDHGIAIVALLYLPIAITGVMLALEVGARAGVPAAMRVRSAFINSSPGVRMAAFGMVVSATIHVALAPSLWSEDHVRTVLFILDGVALTAVAVAALLLRFPPWRAAGVVLLGAEIVAYAGYVVAGMEQLDAVGIATKLVELAVIGVILVDSTHHVDSNRNWLRELVSVRSNGGFLR
jgi:hypothetical protein